MSRGNWNALHGKEYHYMGNSMNGLKLVIEGNDVIYRGWDLIVLNPYEKKERSGSWCKEW